MKDRDKIWRTLADAKANEYYTTIMADKYLVADWITNTALGLVAIVSLIASISFPIGSNIVLVLGMTIVFCLTTMILNPFLLFQKYVRVFNEKRTNLKHLSNALEDLWEKVDDPRFTEDELEREYLEILGLIIENDRFPDRTRVYTHKIAHRTAVEKANVYLSEVFISPKGITVTDNLARPMHSKSWKSKLPGNPMPPAAPMQKMRVY